MNNWRDIILASFEDGIRSNWRNLRQHLPERLPSFEVTNHPLGFSCLKTVLGLPEGYALRMHYWPSEGRAYQEPRWLIHDHIFAFSSVVLYGEITNIFYGVSADTERPNGVIYETAYSGEFSNLVKTSEKVRIKEESRTTVAANNEYRVPSGRFHMTEVGEGREALTILVTRSESRSSPKVVGDLDGEQTYSYSRQELQTSRKEEVISTVASLLEKA